MVRALCSSATWPPEPVRRVFDEQEHTEKEDGNGARTAKDSYVGTGRRKPSRDSEVQRDPRGR